MKKIVLLFIGLCLSLATKAQITTTPSPFEATQSVTLNFNKAGTPLASYTGTIYAHIGVTVNGNTWQHVKGSWGNNTTQPALTLVSGTTYKLDITPDLFSYFGVAAGSSITQICIVLRGASGSPQTQDTFVNVGSFQANLSTPALNSTTLLNSGQSLFIAASNTGGTANYELKANGATLTTSSGTSFTYSDTNITVNKNYELLVSQGAVTFSRKFSVLINPGANNAATPAGIADGINYSSDATKVTLALTAPGKDYVYVAGNFNNWTPTSAHAMKKDGNRFWIELTGLTPGADYMYQYWVVDSTPTTNSPALVKTADPYSTLVLSADDDPWIPAGNFPGVPNYPTGQNREVTWIKTGQPAYNWQVTNFEKPAKEKLVVYEALVRDFDANRSYQNLIDRIDYFKNLGVNAIQLMPVMEFEGTESWGYNTSYHMALDKAYGTPAKFKEFIDLCHENGIAVILDIALNHAFGRNPLVRMWMKDPDGDGWGTPAADSPYFNEVAKHSYSVGEDFNHSSAFTKDYVKRVVKYWIDEYHIDGFRWDLTKGFTQNCTAGNDGCTNGYQQDRVDILKDYASYSWDVDPTHYVIFEHLGIDSEEKEWANFRLNETPSKGVMMWGKMTNEYNQLSMGYNSSNNISRIGHMAHSGFNGQRVIGYPESHDEERLMYKNVTFGNSANSGHDVKNLNVALSRMSAIGAMSLLVPGPKMIWHFGALGWELSIFTCNNGTVNTDSDATSGDCKLDKKPQPQWTGNWMENSARAKIYNDWAKMIKLKKQEAVFSGSYNLNTGTTLQPRLYVWDDALPTTQLKNVVVLSNFDVTTQSVAANFPYVGTWYNLMDNSTVNVTNANMTFSIPAGQFLMFGNKQVTLDTDAFDTLADLALAPNPAKDRFMINRPLEEVEIYTMNGQRVKRFKGQFSEMESYDISDLPTGMYLVKVKDASSREKAIKLVKN